MLDALKEKALAIENEVRTATARLHYLSGALQAINEAIADVGLVISPKKDCSGEDHSCDEGESNSERHDDSIDEPISEEPVAVE